MERLKRVGIISFALFETFVGGLIGLLCGVLYSFGGLVVDIFVSIGVLSGEAMSTPGLSFGTVLAFGALIGMPLIGAGAGFLAGLIGGLSYNLYARWFGGLKVSFR